jgi:predicted ribosomally synthesized peptide with nif11-like leader
MSIESAKAFIERMKTDEDFAKKVTACKDEKARMAFVKKEGFDFTPLDIKKLKSELSDEEVCRAKGGRCGLDNSGTDKFNYPMYE